MSDLANAGMGHSLCGEEQEDLEQFISRVLPPVSS